MDPGDVASLLARSTAAESFAAGLAFCGYVAAARALVGAPGLVRWLGAAVAAMWIASAEFHLLSMLGAFSLPGAAVAVALSTGIAMLFGPGERPIRRWWAEDSRRLRRSCRAIVRSPYRPIALLFSILGTIVVIHSLLLPPLGWDSLTYHCVKSAMWVQHAGFVGMSAPGTWAVYGNYWAGGEVLTAWSMLPFHSDALAMAMQAVHWLLLGLAVIVFVRELGAREPYAALVAVLILSTPTVRRQVGTGYVEIVGLMFLLSGMALALRFFRRSEGGTLLFAFAALGLASGVKIPLFLASLVAVIALLIAASGRTSWSWLTICTLAFATPVAPWVWHSLQSTGAPLSPMPIQVFGMEIGRVNPELEAYLSRPVPPSTLADEGARLVEVLLRGHESPGPTMTVATVIGLASLPRLFHRWRSAALLVSLVLVTSLAGYYSSGLAVVRHYQPSSSVRFALVPLVLGAVLSPTAFAGVSNWRRPYGWLLVAGSSFELCLYLLYDVSPPAAAAICRLSLVLVVLVLAVVACTRMTDSPAARATASAVASSVFLTVASLAHDGMRQEVARMGFMTAPIPPYWFDAAIWVDEPTRPRRIAVTSGPWMMADNWFVYPLMGRRLQNEVVYVPVSRDGAVGHFGSAAVYEKFAAAADLPHWLERLARGRVSDVMSFSPASIELEWMESHPERFRRLIGSAGDWGLFAVETGGSTS